MGTHGGSAQSDEHEQRLLNRDAAMEFLLNKDSSSKVFHPYLLAPRYQVYRLSSWGDREWDLRSRGASYVHGTREMRTRLLQ